ncbi:MAG: lytic transglycosylase domain-containing protein [Alphaproteobacteria bacterium]|nr:lytic transglycosylase domain-containing protein [Alphaproteobacteria bacterium]
MDRMIFLASAVILALFCPVQAHAQEPWEPAVSEASQRFGIPEDWIRAVIKIESGGDIDAVSPKGAMGLMQLMPGTWDDMKKAHDITGDPFDPQANILAGTAYLKAMYERFGYPDMFAAYNAGPGRYEAFLNAEKTLPKETRDYLGKIQKSLARRAEFPLSTASGTGMFYRLSSQEEVSP